MIGIMKINAKFCFIKILKHRVQPGDSFKVLRVGHVGSPIAQGLSMGTATHAVGTSTAMEISGKYGAYASLGLTLNGIMTAIFTPTILRLLGVI